MDAIFPSVLLARRQSGDLIANAVRANVMRSVQQLRDSWPTLQRLHSSNKIAIVGAVYDLRTGHVIWLDD
jgi:carbonic anhydrase